jgi:nitrile hydratase beta subunit
MDGIHDLGGRQGFGKVHLGTEHRGDNEPPFHERWEAAVFAMSAAGARAGAWNNTDRFRHGIERIDPVAYLSHGYYGRWLGGIETLLVEAGIIRRAELTALALELGASEWDLIASVPSATPDPLNEVAAAPTASRPTSSPPRFTNGDRVLTIANGTTGHTRIPSYARGRTGIILDSHGTWVYPDSNAHGLGEAPQHLYTIRFSAAELWGGEAEPGTWIHLDLFEPYLARAEDP